VVTAAPQVQWRLLDVQDFDTRLAQLAHRARTLPEHAAVTDLEARLRSMADRLVAARTVAGDASRELAKAEADVELVRQRSSRDQARLDAGQGGPKDLQALQHEIASLAQRQSALEDVELEVMERVEVAQAAVAELEAEATTLEGELGEVVARRDAALARVDEERQTVERSRADASAGLPADLLALYEKIRAANAGVGAARLRAKRCEGCRMELNPTDLHRIRTSEEDAVVRCEDCGRILVRTPESGL
jgi:hypothetical protein